MNKLVSYLALIPLLFTLTNCGLKASDVMKSPETPEYCKDAYVYKLGIYPNVVTAIEIGALAVLSSVKDSADPMIVVSKKAIDEIALGSAQLALADLATLFTKNSKYAPAAAFAVSQIEVRLKDVVLTQCDKDILTAMFNRILTYAQASKAEKK